MGYCHRTHDQTIQVPNGFLMIERRGYFQSCDASYNGFNLSIGYTVYSIPTHTHTSDIVYVYIHTTFFGNLYPPLNESKQNQFSSHCLCATIMKIWRTRDWQSRASNTSNNRLVIYLNE